MVFSTLLTLVVVPVVYTYLAGRVKDTEVEEPVADERAVARA